MPKNKKWISCGELLDAGLKDFELFSLFRQERLHPTHPGNGVEIIDYDTIEEIYEEILKNEIMANQRRDRRTRPTLPYIRSNRRYHHPEPLSFEAIEAKAKQHYKDLKDPLKPSVYLKRWDQAPEFELRIDGRLAVNFTLSTDTEIARQQLQKARLWLIKRQEVEKFEELRGFIAGEPELKPTPTKQDASTKYPNKVQPIKTGNNIKWSDVKITFIADNEIHVQFGDDYADRQYNHAGFENRKNGKPVRSWPIFRSAAVSDDKCISFIFVNRREVEPVARDLNKKLSLLFPDLAKKPVLLNTKKEAYKFAFQLESTI